MAAVAGKTSRVGVGRQLLGLGALLLTLVPGYVISRIGVDGLVSTPSASASALPGKLLDSEGTSSTRFEEVVASAPTGTEIDAYIREVAIRHRVSEELIAAIIEAESRFDAQAVSRRGALGLMQLMPATAATLDVTDPFDPRENIDAGVRHLRAMMAHFPDNLPLALAAYNAGEKAVIQHRGIPPYRETQEYVHRILGRLRSDRAKAEYDATYAVSLLGRVVAGETVSVILKVTNTGTASWNNVGPCAAVLGAHWYQGRTRLVSETQAASLPTTVSPGQTVTLEAFVSAPRMLGKYALAWDMRAQCDWFTNLGGTLRKQQIEVVTKR